jgi:hypothetical protein
VSVVPACVSMRAKWCPVTQACANRVLIMCCLPVLCRYCKWTLGSTSIVVRCAIDAAIRLGDSTQLVAVHALNEFDPKWAGEWAAHAP